MEGLVEVMSDIFISELEKEVDALETLDAVVIAGTAGATGGSFSLAIRRQASAGRSCV